MNSRRAGEDAGLMRPPARSSGPKIPVTIVTIVAHGREDASGVYPRGAIFGN